MTGDLHDHAFPDSPKWYARRTMESGHMMQAALCWLGIYYLIVKPFRLLGCDNPEALSHYDNTGLSPRFSRIFSTWREYENCQWVRIFKFDFLWRTLIWFHVMVQYIDVRTNSDLYLHEYSYLMFLCHSVFCSGLGKIAHGTDWFLACG